MTSSYTELRGRNHLHVLVEENRRFAEAVNLSGFSTEVQSCPGWTTAEVMFHLCKVQAMFHGMLTGRADSPKELPRLERPLSNDSLVDLFLAGASRLEHLLENTSDDTSVWTFVGMQPAAWVKRRMAHEVLIHRFDVEIATGNVSPVDEVIAADGIDEKFMAFLPWLGGKVSLVGSVHVHCSDTDGEWMLVPSSEGVSVTREHGKGDVAFRGPVRLLLLALWHRIAVDEAIAAGAEVFGNRSVLDAFLTQFSV